MKTFVRLFITHVSILSALVCSAGEALTVRVTRAGELAERSGAEFRGLEALKVVGPLNEADFVTLCDAACCGRLTEIDISEADVLDRKIPNNAFRTQKGGWIFEFHSFYSSVRKVTLPDNIEEIGEYAFFGMDLLSDINMPRSLKKIGEGAFRSCGNIGLNVLEFPESVEFIGKEAFMNCYHLKRASFPGSLKRIGEGAFKESGLESVSFAEGLEVIEPYAFYGCTGLREVVLPQSIIAVNEYAFNKNTLLERFELPDNFDFFSTSMLADNYSLKHIRIPKGIETIYHMALAGCSGLESIELPEGLSELSFGALASCPRLTSLTLPSTLTKIGAASLCGLAGLKSISCKAPVPPEYNSFNPFFDCGCCDDDSTPFDAPEGMDFMPTPKHITLYVPVGSAHLYLAAPGWNYFDNIVETDEFPKEPAVTVEITHMDIETTGYGEVAGLLGDKARRVKSLRIRGPIGESDFATLFDAACAGRLEELDLGNAEVEGRVIPANAFGHTSGRRNLWSFLCPAGLKRVTLPDDIEEIGDYAFYLGSSLETINFPASLKRVGQSAFNSCWSLQASTGELILPEGLEEIKGSAFDYCGGLRDIRFPATLKSIGSYAFRRTSIESLWFPEGLELFREGAFSQCYELKNAYLPNSVRNMGSSAFYHDINLETLHLPENINDVPKSFASSCLSLKNVNFPASVEYYFSSCFYSCISLKEVSFSGVFKRFNRGAFQACAGLEELRFPKDGCNIDARVFCENPGLRRIYSPSPYPPNCYVETSKFGDLRSSFESIVFDYDALWETPKDIPVYVPAGSKERYESAPGWNYFTNFVELDEFPEAGIGEAEADRGEMLVEALPGRVALSGGTMAGNSAYSVYNVAGRLIASGCADSATVEIPLAPGIYIVATPGSRVKVAVP